MNKNALEQLFNLLNSYLIGDLNTMVYEVSARPSGGLGYPGIHTILVGMELLGKLFSGGQEDEHAFNYFWDNYFIQDNPQYNSTRLRKILRNSIRNGTAHYFLVKFGIQISKNNNGNLTRTLNDELNIDLITFFEDFKKSFMKIRELLLNTNDKVLLARFKKGYQLLLNEMKASKVDIDEYVKSLPEYPNTEIKGILTTTKVDSFATVSSQVITTSGYNGNASITRLPDNMLNKGSNNNHE